MLHRVPTGLTAHFDDAGFLVVIARRPASVPGYEGEPYLELTPHRVRENASSPAAWLNRRLTPTGAPPGQDPAAAPRWRVIGQRGRVRFHDHRAHWMGARLPAGTADGDELVAFEIPVTVAGRRTAISGALVYHAGAPASLRYAVAAACGLAGLGAVWLARRVWRSDRPESPRAGDAAILPGGETLA